MTRPVLVDVDFNRRGKLVHGNVHIGDNVTRRADKLDEPA